MARRSGPRPTGSGRHRPGSPGGRFPGGSACRQEQAGRRVRHAPATGRPADDAPAATDRRLALAHPARGRRRAAARARVPRLRPVRPRRPRPRRARARRPRAAVPLRALARPGLRASPSSCRCCPGPASTSARCRGSPSPSCEAAAPGAARRRHRADLRGCRCWPLWTAALWVADEALRGRFVLGGFPWGRLGFSQTEGPLLALAAYGGVPLVTFAVALTGALLAAAALAAAPGPVGAADDATAACAHRARLAAAAVLAVPALGALAWLPLPGPSLTEGGPTTTVAVIQGNVPRAGLDFNAQRRAVLDNHVQQTLDLAADVAAGEQAAAGRGDLAGEQLRHRPLPQRGRRPADRRGRPTAIDAPDPRRRGRPGARAASSATPRSSGTPTTGRATPTSSGTRCRSASTCPARVVLPHLQRRRRPGHRPARRRRGRRPRHRRRPDRRPHLLRGGLRRPGARRGRRRRRDARRPDQQRHVRLHRRERAAAGA